jgi:hypothetical protein
MRAEELRSQVASHWHEAETVEVLVVGYRRIVELVAATWVRAEGSAGGPSSCCGTGQPSRRNQVPSPCRERPSLAPPRTPVQAASSLSGPGNGSDSRLTADSLLAAHPCNQLRLFH